MSTINIIRKFEHQLTLAAAYDMSFDQLFGVIGQSTAARVANTTTEPLVLLHLWQMAHDIEGFCIEGQSLCGLVWSETPSGEISPDTVVVRCPACEASDEAGQ